MPFLKADTVVVADDRAAADPIASIAMTAACPAKVKLALLRIEEAAAAVAAGTLPGSRTLLIVNSVQALEALWKKGARASQVNLGNVPIAPGRKRVTPSVALSPEEVKTLEEVAATGAQVEVRAVPKEKAADLQAIHQAVDA